MKIFADLNLPQPLMKALASMGFEHPTPIQIEAIPVALTHRDVIGCAQTGTGKTAAFSIPIISTLLQQTEKTALILVPTRELAIQVCEVVKNLTAFTPSIQATHLIGGAPMKKQIRALSRKPRMIIATPGRLVDHLRQGTVSLSNVGILVLDEADRMLDMGFAPQLGTILGYLPKMRQTLLFSATVPPDILNLARKFLNDPVKVQVSQPSQTVPQIKQKSREVRHEEKNDVLLDELNARSGTVLIFARTQARTDRLARYLEEYGVGVARIHGGRTQGQRNRALQGFKDGSFRVLVATDIAARGIDVDHVAHVINYDLPMVPEDYVHRIGRTGRAGRSGEALSLISPDDRSNWNAIDRLLTGKTSAASPAPDFDRASRGPKQNARDRMQFRDRKPSRFGKLQASRSGGSAGSNDQRSSQLNHRGHGPQLARQLSQRPNVNSSKRFSSQ